MSYNFPEPSFDRQTSLCVTKGNRKLPIFRQTDALNQSSFYIRRYYRQWGATQNNGLDQVETTEYVYAQTYLSSSFVRVSQNVRKFSSMTRGRPKILRRFQKMARQDFQRSVKERYGRTLFVHISKYFRQPSPGYERSPNVLIPLILSPRYKEVIARFPYSWA